MEHISKHSHNNLRTCWTLWSALQKKRVLLWARPPVLTPVPSQAIYGCPPIAVGSRRVKIVRSLHTCVDSSFSLNQDEQQQRSGSVKSQDSSKTLRHFSVPVSITRRAQRTHLRNNGAASCGDPVASSRIGNVVVPGRQTDSPKPFISSSTFQSLSGDLYKTTLTDLNRNVRPRKADTDSPKPHPFISSSTFQSLSGDLYKTTLTDLNRNVRGVCNSSEGIVNVASITMFVASWHLAIFVPLFVNV